MPISNAPLSLQLLKFLHQLGAAVELLDFVSSGITHNADGFLAVSVFIAGNPEIIPVQPLHFINDFFIHGWPPSEADVPSGIPRQRLDIPGL